MHALHVGVLVLTLAACKEKAATPAAGSSDPAGPQTTTPTRKVTPPPVVRRPPPAANAPLVIKPAKLDLVASGLTEVTIDDQGIVAFSGKPKVKLSADGTMTTPDGKPIARLAEDGTLEFAEPTGDAPVIQIDEHGTVTRDGETVFKIDESGEVWARKGDGKLDNNGLAVFEGPPETRRALAMLIVVMSTAKAAPPPPPKER